MQVQFKEVAPGSGKTHSALNVAGKSTDTFLFAAPTLLLLDDMFERFCASFDPSQAIKVHAGSHGSESVEKILDSKADALKSVRVIFVTQQTLTRYGAHAVFAGRHLFIDEVPDLIEFSSFSTHRDDADVFLKDIHTQESAINRLKEYANGSDYLSKSKYDFLKSLTSDREYADIEPTWRIDKDTGEEVATFAYASFTDPLIWDNFASITVLTATFVGTLCELYFKHLVQADIVESDLQVRGNPMLNNVTIYPMIAFDDDRDYCGIDHVEPLIELIVGRVQGVALGSNVDMVDSTQKNKSMIGVGNRDWHTRLHNREPITLIPSVCHGMNSWSHATMAAAFSCVNPVPFNLKMMRKVSLAWDLEEDAIAKAFVRANELDRVWQCVTRTAIRDPKNNADLKFFVLYQRQADFLASRLTNARIDWRLAQTIEIDKGGARIGNTNAKGKGCPFVAALKDAGVKRAKTYRIIEAFKKANGRDPSELNPSDMIKVLEAGRCKDLRKMKW